MIQLANRAEVLALLDEVKALEDELTPNEREMVAHLREKYETPGDDSFDDKICLEVIIRNVGIRRGHGMTASEAAVRTVDLPRAKDDT